MTDSDTTRLLRRRRVTEYRQRGPIYNWLRAHYADICRLMASGEGTWPKLCREMQRHGVVARRGFAPTEKAASKAWQTVCRDLADDEPAAPKRPGSVYPSRIPKDWRPTVVAPPASASTTLPASIAPGSLMRPPPPRGPGMSLMEKLTGRPDVIRSVPVQDGERDVDAEIAEMRLEMRKRNA
jgi:hypothetical protein